MKEILIEFLFGTGEHQMAIAPLAIAAIGAAPGLIKAAGSLFGGGKRRRAQKRAQAKAAAAEEALQNQQFTNTYANLENTAEDLTVNQDAANFQAQQADASLANIVDSAAQSGGPVDYTALAGQALGAKQQASASIAQQEQANQQARAQQAAQNQRLEAQGEAQLQQDQYSQKQQLFNVANNQLAAANKAREQAKADLVGGISEGVGGAAGALGGAGVEGFKGFARAKGGESAFKRIYNLYNDNAPFKRDMDKMMESYGMKNSPFMQTEDDPTEPKKKTYSGDRFERRDLLKQLVDRGGHTIIESAPGRYTIGGQQVTIDPTTGGFKGHGAKRAEEYFAKQAQHIYDQDYTKALKEAGLQAGFDERQGGGGARGAVIQGTIDAGGDVSQIEGAQQRYREGAGDVQALEYADDANRLEARDVPLNRGPLYRYFKMKYNRK
ncbi:MAG: hypothetical protein GDA44_11630 [Prochloron sp. SP5CPC1]|nr:hypothetical protein [Candidatus Paraprochloron terpiosi SP5CPC1]